MVLQWCNTSCTDHDHALSYDKWELLWPVLINHVYISSDERLQEHNHYLKKHLMTSHLKHSHVDADASKNCHEFVTVQIQQID